MTKQKSPERNPFFPIWHSTDLPCQHKQGMEIKGSRIGKEEVKSSLFVYDMVLYIENPKDTTHKKKKLLDLINNLSKVVGQNQHTEIS